MIPKIIHYCWFGGKPLTELAEKCIESWKKYLPSYEIKEWNESNYPISKKCRYVQEAYRMGKYAFVSDYARFDILYTYGGLYFDTDVELIKPIDDIISDGSFMGCESCNTDKLSVAPGLGLYANPGLGLYKEILENYEQSYFINEDNSLNLETVVIRTKEILKKHGFQGNGEIENIAEIKIYPPEYFCPKDYTTGKLSVKENTRSIHHYSASWLSKDQKKSHEIYKSCIAKYGERKGRIICRVLDFPLRLKIKINQKGVLGTLKFAGNKIIGKKDS